MKTTIDINLRGFKVWTLTEIQGDINGMISCNIYTYETKEQAEKRRDAMIERDTRYYGMMSSKKYGLYGDDYTRIIYKGEGNEPDFAIQYVIKSTEIK